MTIAMVILMKDQPVVGKVKVAMRVYASMNVVMAAPLMILSVLTMSAYHGVCSTLVRQGEECTAQGCVDLCAGVTCDEGQVCAGGECSPSEDCTFTGCADGERCRPEGCEMDPCVGVNCGEGSFCRDGECVFSCAEVSCPAAHACFDGLCEPTGCLPLGCPYEGEVCLGHLPTRPFVTCGPVIAQKFAILESASLTHVQV